MRSAPSTPRRRVLLAAAVLLAAPARAAAPPLRIALAPFLSPTALLTAFRPLREHLERELGRGVELYSAKDFRHLLDETRRAEHDVVQLPAHLARLAMADWGWRQVAGTVDRLDVLLLVRRGGPVVDLAALKGRRIGMLDPLSLTATVGRRWLEQQGLEDVQVLPVPSINSGLISLDRGEIEMLVAGRTQLATLPATTPRTERVFATIGDIPGPVYIARPTLADAELESLRTAMGRFRPDPAHETSAANATLRPLDDARLAALDPFAAIARRAFAAR